MAIFLRHIEYRREHLSRQFHGHFFHPVKVFVSWQIIENCPCAFLYQSPQFLQTFWCKRWRNDFALVIVFGGVLHDKHRQVKRRVFGWCLGRSATHAYAAVVDITRKNLMVGINRHDVFVGRGGPIWTKHAFLRQVKRIFRSEAFKIRLKLIVFKQRGMPWVQLCQRNFSRILMDIYGPFFLSFAIGHTHLCAGVNIGI